MSLGDHWKDRKRFLRRTIGQRAFWRLFFLLALVLYVMYKLGVLEQHLAK